MRASYVSEVLDREGKHELLRKVWMMRQPQPVRESYISEILEPALDGRE